MTAGTVLPDTRPSKFFKAMSEANNQIDEFDGLHRRVNELESAAAVAAEMFAAAIGFYACGDCLASFEFTEDSGLDEYAALNRWLGHHERCAEMNA